ncbi:hypothetical protein SSAG_03931 [Streptomyces sp. Mg1]|nr:hypothetical protein SSAG_03931 [Streptomyces sp. Mg1]
MEGRGGAGSARRAPATPGAAPGSPCAAPAPVPERGRVPRFFFFCFLFFLFFF